MPHPRRLALLTLLVPALVGLAACGDDTGDESSGTPTKATGSATPLGDLDTTQVAVARADFCARVAPTAVEKALDGPITDSDTWSNGDDARLADGVHDVANEFGCAWTTTDGTVARAWVFAPPVTRAQAQQLARQAAGSGCDTLATAPAFGDPTSAVQCTQDDASEVTYRGLFGDAWLACSLQTPGQLVALRRPTAWCSAVLEAARA